MQNFYNFKNVALFLKELKKKLCFFENADFLILHVRLQKQIFFKIFFLYLSTFHSCYNFGLIFYAKICFPINIYH